MSALTLEAYEQAERELAVREAVVGLRIHAIVTLVVSAALVAVNVLFASEFPWSAFAVGGMGIGLFFHWFGYRHTEDDVRRRQLRSEQKAQARVSAI